MWPEPLSVDVVVDMVMPWMVPYVMEGCSPSKSQLHQYSLRCSVLGQIRGRCIHRRHASVQGIQGSRPYSSLWLRICSGWTNVLARRLANRLDNVDSIKMRIGKATHLPGEHEYDWVLRPWNPGWSPKQALIDCASPIRAGRRKIRPVSAVRRT